MSYLRRRKALLWIITFTAAALVGLFKGVILNEGDYYDLYSAPSLDHPLDFFFHNESGLLGMKAYQKESFRNLDPTHIVVDDINNDNREDYIALYRDPNGKVQIKFFLNVENKYFREEPKYTASINKIIGEAIIYTVATTDLDNDGWNDLILVYFKRNQVAVRFIQNDRDNFIEGNWKTPLITEGDKRNINLLDFNNDGYIDIYLTSLFNQRELLLVPFVSNGRDGGRNNLVINHKGKYFTDVTDSVGIKGNSLSWTAALSDFNKDGFTDFLDVNDFGYNQFWMNAKGMKLTDYTNRALNVKNVSHSMSSEVADFNNDGFFDIYVSNVNRASFYSGNNLLLFNNPQEPGTFENGAKELGLDACGWSWGVKAFEANRDGTDAIIVVNSPSQTRNQAERLSFNSSPLFMRKYFISMSEYFERDMSWLSQVAFKNISEFQERNCLFIKSGDRYYDAALTAGIDDIKGGKTVVETDFNDDGYPDFIIGNRDSSPILYRGEYKGKNSWIGLKLIGTKTNRDAIGAVVEARFKSISGDRKKIKQIYPTNGYQSQSTKRLIFGIAANEELSEIIIRWPSGNVQTLKQFETRKYNNVQEN